MCWLLSIDTRSEANKGTILECETQDIKNCPLKSATRIAMKKTTTGTGNTALWRGKDSLRKAEAGWQKQARIYAGRDPIIWDHHFHHLNMTLLQALSISMDTFRPVRAEIEACYNGTLNMDLNRHCIGIWMGGLRETPKRKMREIKSVLILM
ncbi:hypothetical protein BC830DRAFT_1114902, partial [Chytriomyces sp. MP71]